MLLTVMSIVDFLPLFVLCVVLLMFNFHAQDSAYDLFIYLQDFINFFES